MKFVRLVTSFLYETPLFRSCSGFNSNLYCTKAMVRPRDTTGLFRRISPPADSNVSIVPILDQWMNEGHSVDKQTLIDIMTMLHSRKRFSHALQISMWMADKRYIGLTPSDAAFRLYLISKVKGMDETERYFNNLSQKLKCLPVYGALLNCYANAQFVEKAEALMQKIRSLGYPDRSWNYIFMLNLYRKTRNMEKFNALLLEMKEKGMDKTKDSLNIQLSAYSDVKDIEGMDKIVSLMEGDPSVVRNWNTYSTAAAGYIKAGLFDKALQMLKKAEAHATGKEYDAYDHLLTLYGKIGRKDDVLRVWSLYKHKYKVYNKGYRSVLNALVNLGDIEMAEEIVQEWESQGLNYDMRIPNTMIPNYFRKGLVGKAEALLNKAISNRGKSYAWTWYHMYEGYVLNEQYEKAVEMMKKVIADSCPGQKPVPTVESIKACLSYLKGVGDNQQAEEFLKLLLDSDVVSFDQLLFSKMNSPDFRMRTVQ